MSDKKMIVRNCPSIYGIDDGFLCSYREEDEEDEKYCYDCTDCVLKQIVELCEQYKKDFNTTNGVWLLANNITNLLDIQECE